MGHLKKKKAQKKDKPGFSLITFAHNHWFQKWPVLLFILGFSVLMILFYAFWLSDFFQGNIHPAIVSTNARLSSSILNLFDMGTMAMNEMIYSCYFSISIARGCDAVEAMALFATALLAFPAKWKFKLPGFFAGIAILFALNILRIISLFLIGLHYPKEFEFMHVEVWQALFIIFAVGLWIFWIKWARKEEVHDAAK